MAISSLINIGKSIASSPTGKAAIDLAKDVMGSSRARKVAIGIGLGGSMAAGFYNATAQPTIKAAMDIAFDDPNADRAVLGTDLTPGILLGGTLNSGLAGATIGAAARSANATRFYGVPNPVTAGTATAGMGALVGAGIGFKKAGGVGALAGGVIGAIGGGMVGAGGSIAATAQRASMDRQILNESPFYNTSLMTAERLNASGNIVLGAHNTRRGSY